MTARRGGRPPRVALVSIGVGRVQRGFERYFTDLHRVLRDRMDVTLFKSAGECEGDERVPGMLRPATGVMRRLPVGSSEYARDSAAYALCLTPELLWGARYDIVHCIDPPLARVLQHLRPLGRLRPRLLFTEGVGMPLEYYPRAEHIHHVAPGSFETARAAGWAESRMSLIPCGLHTDRFTAQADRRGLRRRHGVPENAFVVLAVSAVKKVHKRVDHIIEEVSRLGDDVFLWIDGNPEDSDLPKLARERLGERCRITHVPSDQVPELYRLADVLTHASLSESFGLAIVEALCSDLPVLVHDSPHFEWLVGDRDSLLDMGRPGGLAERLHEFRERRGERSAARAAALGNRTRERFDWRSIAQDYTAMYECVASSRAALRTRG